ncbi:CBS-domain-containing protein [Lactarius hatsudake]|nr:CBS-domain-containing protein [Lactarius hatsudake]
MSRIPVPSHTRTLQEPISLSQERAVSPVPSSRHNTASMSSLSGHASPVGGKKLSKRALGDEALRKKIENELSRKRTVSTAQQAGRRRGGKPNVAKGTVAALKPSPALTVPDTITVAEASQLCAAKRTDCVLVVDDEEGLSGIFTAKDLAYRVTAEGIDPHTTPVSQVMTRNPMVTRDTTSATEALQLMVERHFRHLPVCNEDGNVVGLLDITKVFHEALDKVERSSSASEKLYSALAGVQSELGAGLGANPQTAAMLAYVEALREKTALPDLTTIMDSRTQPAVVGPRATVRDVARLMRERRTTAVCVMEPTTTPSSHPRIAGIFTSKDVVLRVIAAGLDASMCSVVRVMTPHPDTAPPTMTIHDALKKMHSEDGRLVAIVDVLKLTYATLEQNAQDAEGGPMWGRFFDSIGGHDETESAYSGSHAPVDANNSSFSLSHLQQSPHSEVHPNDSASVADDASALGYGGHKVVGNIPSITGLAVPVDDGTYVFKFRTPSGNTHRFQARKDDVENLRDIVSRKLTADPFFTEFKPINTDDPVPDPLDFKLAYTDADGDTVLMTSDTDVTDAVKIARGGGVDRVVLIVQGGRGWADVGVGKSEDKPAAAPAAAQKESKEVEKTESMLPYAFPSTSPIPGHGSPTETDEVLGIPRDLLLPASIGALAVVIIGIFTISRFTRD